MRGTTVEMLARGYKFSTRKLISFGDLMDSILMVVDNMVLHTSKVLRDYMSIVFTTKK